MAADNGSIGANGRALFDQGIEIELRAALGVFAAGVHDIGKDHGGTAEDIVLQGDAFIHRDIVLDLDEVADGDIVGHVDILAQRAVFTDDRVGLHMGEVPDTRAFTDGDVIVDIGGFVDAKWFITHLKNILDQVKSRKEKG